MLDLAQHCQDPVSIPPVGQLLVCETRRRQTRAAMATPLIMGLSAFASPVAMECCANSRGLAPLVLFCPTPARSRRVGAQPPPSPAVVDAPPVSTSGSTDSVTVPSPGVPSLLPVYPRLHLLSRALTYDSQPPQDGGERMAPDWRVHRARAWTQAQRGRKPVVFRAVDFRRS
jgi:hypothetical protein